MRLFIFLDDGPLSRTPEHYKKFIYDWKVATPSPVHYIPEDGLWKKEENGEMYDSICKIFYKFFNLYNQLVLVH